MKNFTARAWLFLSLALITTACISDTSKPKQELILEYFEYIGLKETFALQAETMFQDYVEAFDYLPQEFWQDEEVIAVFEDFKITVLRGYVEAMESEVSAEELEFLVAFYSSEDGKRVVELGKRIDPLIVASNSEAGRNFNELFTLQ